MFNASNAGQPDSLAGWDRFSTKTGTDDNAYRHWLIGVIAGGLAANPAHSVSQIADLSVQLSDEIIRRAETFQPCEV